MHGQLQQLLELMERPRISLRVVPFDAGLHPGIEGPIVILNFVDQPDLVYIEASDTTGLLEERQHLARARIDWEKSRQGTPREDSTEFIAEIAGGLKATLGGLMTQWRKSSRSSSSANCVEVGWVGTPAVRDSKNASGPVLRFPHTAWTAFLSERRSGTSQA